MYAVCTYVCIKGISGPFCLACIITREGGRFGPCIRVVPITSEIGHFCLRWEGRRASVGWQFWSGVPSTRGEVGHFCLCWEVGASSVGACACFFGRRYDKIRWDGQFHLRIATREARSDRRKRTKQLRFCRNAMHRVTGTMSSVQIHGFWGFWEFFL